MKSNTTLRSKTSGSNAEKTPYTDRQKALSTLQSYCAYQDRCHQEARQKLRDMGVFPDWIEEIITELIQDNFLNEERFARSYARGKFKMKRWGRNRIKQELKRRQISAYCIKKGLSEIDEDEYRQVMEAELLRRHTQEKKAKHPWLRRRKLVDYMVKRGYEAGLLWPLLDELGI
ncbi:MAG: regulatory protein RecX [Bacteroidota bacterium]